MLVLGLDIARVTGFAHGDVHANAPTWGCVRFGSPNTPSSEVFGNAMLWGNTFIPKLKPDLVFVEALLPPDAMKDRTSRATRDILCGLNAIMYACAHAAGVGEIASAQVNDIRQHFIYDRTLPRKFAKMEVKRKCHELGWNVSNDNEADAVACWSYACSLIDPKLALRGSPLFGKIASIF
jgi:hypothetical protein